MKRLLSFLLLMCLSYGGFTQVNFVKRLEISSDFYDDTFEMLRLETGVVAFRTIPEKGLNFRLVLQFINLDFDLNSEKGLFEYPVRSGYSLVGYDYSDEAAYLFFQKGTSLNADRYIFKINLEDNQGFEYEADNLLGMQLLEFLVENGKAIFMGDSDGRPAIQIFDLDDKSVHTIQGIYGNDTQIIQIQKLPEIDALQVVISRKGQYRNREIVINTYDFLGNLLREIRVDNFGEENQEILEGILLPPDRYQQALIGSYGIERRDAYQGMYIMDINEFGEYEFKLYTLEDFPGFFNYLPEKLREKRIAEVEKNAEKGKSNNIREVYSIRSVVPEEDAYYIYFDHYNIINSRGNNRPGGYRPGRYYRYDQLNRMGYTPFFNDVYNTRMGMNPMAMPVTTEFKYISAHFIKVGKEGNVIWDNASTYDEFGTLYPQPFGEMAVVENEVYHVYVKDLIIKMSYFKNGEKIFEDESFEIELVNEEERIRDTNAGSLQLVHWYGPYYLLSGNQRVRFLDENNKEDTKDVFFMTKILVEGDAFEAEDAQEGK
ncbi:transcriptional regulator [Algoriphagus sediminis]|uniref:Transcriptional regulator n=1 Tax=Algoriphagus sediminis TaxID=3057113 RepID=A0ABT7YGN0_9BACT|nr:transcriptional regulator [Algoriphagus sediminis]MDN3205675.1 transcriptional regulator [Algoriphagus sediminis]